SPPTRRASSSRASSIARFVAMCRILHIEACDARCSAPWHSAFVAIGGGLLVPSCSAMAPITITDIKTFVTQPARERLVVVKVETSEAGLFGLGCATFTQRAFAVETMLNRHLR